jgi:hypothetical protein
MMGRQARGQERLFYEFSLDEIVPADHMVRRIDAVLDTSWVLRLLCRRKSTSYSSSHRNILHLSLQDKVLRRPVEVTGEKSDINDAASDFAF